MVQFNLEFFGKFIEYFQVLRFLLNCWWSMKVIVGLCTVPGVPKPTAEPPYGTGTRKRKRLL